MPRETVLHEPTVVSDCCDRSRLARLGESVTEVLEKIPARLKVIGMRGRAMPVGSKYANGLPPYRQSAVLVHEGLDGHAAWWLMPSAELIGRHAIAQPVLWTDPIPTCTWRLAPAACGLRFWCYAVDPRSYSGRGRRRRQPLLARPE